MDRMFVYEAKDIGSSPMWGTKNRLGMSEFLFEGTILNPNEKIVNSIRKRLVKTDGYCPCNQKDVPKEDTKCPCLKYRTTGECCCTLYVKENDEIF